MPLVADSVGQAEAEHEARQESSAFEGSPHGSDTGTRMHAAVPGGEDNPQAEAYKKRSGSSLMELAEGAVIPHQAPQRWRVSSSALPKTKVDRITLFRSTWKSRIHAEVNMGVPSLLHIIEPEIVFEHVKSFDPNFGKVLEGNVTPNQFLQFFHKGGRPAFGVYEGNYRDLMAAVEELIRMLKEMAAGKGVKRELPALALPTEVLPVWDDYKPRLSVIPPKPEERELKLPAFEPVVFEASMPFVAPELLEVPEWVEDWEDVPDPEWREPADPEMPEFIMPDEDLVERPTIPKPPRELPRDGPMYGKDWTGTAPTQVELPPWEAKEKREVEDYTTPPARLSEAPLIERDLGDRELKLDLEPVPKVEVLWRDPPLGEDGRPLRRSSSKDDASAASGGQPWGPVVWLNWEAPFADPPPNLDYYPPPPMPVNPPEPTLELPEPQPMPVEKAADLLDEPIWSEPDMSLPEYVHPLEPKPVGFMRGVAPLLVLDVSGTMNPAMRGLFMHMKEVVAEILDPAAGELAASSAVFDVIAYNSAAYVWSAAYNGHQALLESTRSRPPSGRPHGGRIVSGRAGMKDAAPPPPRPQMQQMPTDVEYLREAQAWVRNWPEARGNTNLMSALAKVKEYGQCDGLYLFSDGMMDDPLQTMRYVEEWMRELSTIPPIHTVGFYQAGSDGGVGARFLKELALLTGGSYRVYDPTVHHLYSPNGEAQVYDLMHEPENFRSERLWVERELRRIRRENLNLGVFERLEVTIARVQELHRTERLESERERKSQRRERMWNDYLKSIEDTKEQNERIKEDTVRRHMEDSRRIMEENKGAIKAAQDAYDSAIVEWDKECSRLKAEWEESAREGVMVKRTREELRARILKRFSYRWAELKHRITLDDEKGIAALQATLSEVGKEAAGEVKPELREMAAEFAATLAEVECLNLITDAKITADWDVQFTKLREINADFTRRRRLRAEALSGFQSDVNGDYTADFLKNLILGAAKDEALATLEVELHAQQRQRVIAATNRRNTELRIAHYKEVKARKVAQRQYERDLDAYEENKENLQRQYKDAVRLAEIEYEQMTNSARARHELKCAQVRDQWENKRKRLLSTHEERVTSNRIFNQNKREEVRLRQQAHNEAMAKNKETIAAARQKYNQIFEAEKAEHDAAVETARAEYIADCEKMAADHEANQARALEEWEGLRDMLTAKNKSAEESARERFQADFTEAKRKHDLAVAAAKEAHAKLSREVEEYNAEMRPRMERAERAEKELERASLFFEEIRACAARLAIGINLQPAPVPCLDRVVEMSSLMGALRKAYYDCDMTDLPWPDRELAGEQGIGWTLVKPARSLNGPDRTLIRSNIEREATRRISARHRDAIKAAAAAEAEAIEEEERLMQVRERLTVGASPMGTRRPQSASFASKWHSERPDSGRMASVPEGSTSLPARPVSAPSMGMSDSSATHLAAARSGVKVSVASSKKGHGGCVQSPRSVLSPTFSSPSSSRNSSAGRYRGWSPRSNRSQPARASAISAWEVQSKLALTSSHGYRGRTGFVQSPANRSAMSSEASNLEFPLIQVEMFDY